jgi:hypothetical protein
MTHGKWRRARRIVPEQHKPRRESGLQHLCPSVFICGGAEFLRLREFERAAAVEELEKVAFVRLVPGDLHRGDGTEVQAVD